MKAYSYLRFSTPEQIKGDSTRRQTELAKKYAEEHGLELDEKLTFKDLGVSAFRGKNAETGKLKEFLEAVNSGLVEQDSYLLVESLDRISRRQARKALHILEEICEAGITVVTLMDGREYTEESLDNDPTSLLMSILVFMRAREESETKSNRIKEVWKAKRRKMPEQAVSARLPAWLELDKETNKFRVIEERAEVVREVFSMAAKGQGINGIVKYLNQAGIPTFGSGQNWYSGYIWMLLNSETVTGDFTPNIIEYEDGKKTKKRQQTIPDYYPVIVPREVHDQVKELVKSKAPLRGRAAGKEVKNIFGGLAKCPLCGSTMGYLDKGQRKTKYLVCSKARVGAGCQYKAVQYDQVESAFIQDARILEPPITDEKLDEQWETLNNELEMLQDYHLELLEGIEKGKPKALMNRMIKDVEAQIEELEKQIASVVPEIVSRREKLTTLNMERLEQACKENPVDRGKLNTILRQLFSSITMDYLSGNLMLEWKQGGESAILFAMPESQNVGLKLN
jgi:DNA invertase Pin-like site-specific DNA recombinase